jgi:hypothetical protein
MPTRYLSADQRKQFGRFDGTFSQEDLAKYFTLDQEDLGVLLSLRGPRNRLGYATILCSARFIGTFPESSGDVPAMASTYLQAQLDIGVDVSLSDYFSSKTVECH